MTTTSDSTPQTIEVVPDTRTDKASVKVVPPAPRAVEVYFSTDVETDGPIPGPYSMISFGSVACAVRYADGVIQTLDVDLPENTFYAELKPISTQFIPEALAVSGLDRDALVQNGEEPREAMDRYANWINSRTAAIGGHGTRAVFAAYPLGFDWMFVYWYLVSFSSLPSPFGHSSHLDMKTMFATKAGKAIRSVGKRSIPKHLLSKRKHTHHAVDDAREQGDFQNNLFAWKGVEQK